MTEPGSDDAILCDLVAQIAAAECQAINASTAASTGPNRIRSGRVPIAPSSQKTANASQSITTGSPVPRSILAAALGNNGRATNNAVIAASNQGRSRSPAALAGGGDAGSGG